MDWAAYLRERGAALTERSDDPEAWGLPAPVALDFGDRAGEYEAIRRAAGLHDRSYRGLLAVRGDDRLVLLHNLLTNEVRNLQPGDGVYAFAVTVQGRVVFDTNVLAGPEEVLLDVHGGWVDRARAHLERYIITEDVTVEDVTPRYARLALLGPATPRVLERLGVRQVAAMAALQQRTVRIGGHPVLVVRHDFAGPLGAELLLPGEQGQTLWGVLEEAVRVEGGRPVGVAAVRTVRIESGLPASPEDIDERVIPPETGQAARGISYVKGCYVGQEVIERLRSRGALARRLRGLVVEGDVVPPHNAAVVAGERRAGRVTSACWSPRRGGVIALAYVATAHAAEGTALAVETPAGPVAARVVDLPFVPVDE